VNALVAKKTPTTGPGGGDSECDRDRPKHPFPDGRADFAEAGSAAMRAEARLEKAVAKTTIAVTFDEPRRSESRPSQ